MTGSIARQLEERGLMAPVPTRGGLRTSAIKRTPFGAKKRAMVQTELGFYPAFEALLLLHRCDFWHCVTAQTSQPGLPDYVLFREGWIAWVELKARSTTTGRAGKVSHAQLRYKKAIETGGGEWRTFLLPDEWTAVDEWLISRTGKEHLRGRGRS